MATKYLQFLQNEKLTFINANDVSTTSVTVPSSSEFIEAAIELSKILRLAKIEAPLRPKVIGAIALAMYQGEIDITTENELDSLNSLAHRAHLRKCGFERWN